jgi:predicted amidophosphoribosyltransferase
MTQRRQPVDRPFDIRCAGTVDRLIQRLLKLEKCKFCGAVISERNAICDRCGKAQV